jgi:hypothetical protein
VDKKVSYVKSIVINAPAQRVFQQIADVERRALWYPLYAECRLPQGKSMAPEVSFRAVINIAERRLESTLQVAAYTPDLTLKLKALSGLDLEEEWSLKPQAGGVEVTLTTTLTLPSWAGILGKVGDKWFLEMQLEKQQEASLQKLKTNAETNR